MLFADAANWRVDSLLAICNHLKIILYKQGFLTLKPLDWLPGLAQMDYNEAHLTIDNVILVTGLQINPMQLVYQSVIPSRIFHHRTLQMEN